MIGRPPLSPRRTRSWPTEAVETPRLGGGLRVGVLKVTWGNFGWRAEHRPVGQGQVNVGAGQHGESRAVRVGKGKLKRAIQ